MKILFDAYTRKARLVPVLLVSLPGGLMTLAFFPKGQDWWGGVLSLFMGSGGVALLAQLGRDWGKKKEPRLYRMWGGKPATRLLRHRDAPNRITLDHRHRKLQQLLPVVRIPTLEEEDADPRRADEVYDHCVAFLRDQTRDRKRFPLVFEELCSYGFRRNLWGMKPFGITAAALGVLTMAGTAGIRYHHGGAAPTIQLAAAGICELLLLLAWFFLVTPDWVRVPAEAYADRLVSACDAL